MILYDSIALGCIPVLVAGDVDLPFETALDYSEFAVKLPPERSGELAAILRAIPEAAKRAKRQRLESVKAAVSRPEPGHTVEGSAFSYLLQELQSKVRYMRHSGHKFWTHPIAHGTAQLADWQRQMARVVSVQITQCRITFH